MIRIGKIELPDCPLIMAPMEDITDSPFRAICKMYGADLLISEFISSEGLIRDADKSVNKMTFEESERPIGIQIFGHDEESLKRSAEIAASRNPDFIDLNYGCPVRKVVMKGGGAAMMRDIPKMIRFTSAVIKAINIPVTVKTRLGWDDNSRNIVEIAERLQDTGVSALSIHGRTRAQLYGGSADWTLIGEIKNNPAIKIPVFGNGDINSAAIAKEMKERYKVDGLMVGRAAVGNPWIFREIREYIENGRFLPPPSLEERVRVLKLHLEKSIIYKGERCTVLELRKFYSGYFRGIPDSKQYRTRLMTTESAEAINEILDDIIRIASQQDLSNG